MPLRTTPTDSWLRRTDRPSRPFGTGDDDFELYEEDDAFVLSVELPGFDVDNIDVRWVDGLLNVSAEHVDERRDRTRTYHRRFRFPKGVVDEDIGAEYENGVLTVRLPIAAGAAAGGTEIEVES